MLADGFSCRTQLRQAGTREPVHLATLAARALRALTVLREPAARLAVAGPHDPGARGRSGSPVPLGLLLLGGLHLVAT